MQDGPIRGQCDRSVRHGVDQCPPAIGLRCAHRGRVFDGPAGSQATRIAGIRAGGNGRRRNRDQAGHQRRGKLQVAEDEKQEKDYSHQQ